MKPSLYVRTPSETSSINHSSSYQTILSIIPIYNKDLNHQSTPVHGKIKQLEKETKPKDTKITSFFSSAKESKCICSKEEEKMNQKPLRQFDLSQETKAFLSNIQKSDNESQYQPKTQMSLLEAFSIREKYHNLLLRKLILPVHYNKLLHHFIELDKMLLSNKTKQTRSIKCVSTPKEEIMKMLFVWPNCFNIHSLTNNSSNIVIGSNIDSNLSNHSLKKQRDKRQKEFRNKQLQLVNNQHKAFLNKNGLTNFNPFKYNTWHSDFNIDQCPEIPVLNHHLLS